MPYSKVTLKNIKQDFGIKVIENQKFFSKDINKLTISDYLQTNLEEFAPLALSINTEKSRSEWIIAPILGELRRIFHKNISLFSGTTFNVDQEQGLEGQCDYLISLNSEQFYITAPVIAIVEAKKENIVSGLGQCIATMYAANIFNKQENNTIDIIYGIVTTGTTWKFLKLENNKAYIDIDEYYLTEIEMLLGILYFIINQQQKIEK
jgi:hypothetical protein